MNNRLSARFRRIVAMFRGGAVNHVSNSVE